MVVHVGFRRFQARPVYTQHNTNADKHLVERYFQLGCAVLCWVLTNVCGVRVCRLDAVGMHLVTVLKAQGAFSQHPVNVCIFI